MTKTVEPFVIGGMVSYGCEDDDVQKVRSGSWKESKKWILAEMDYLALGEEGFAFIINYG